MCALLGLCASGAAHAAPPLPDIVAHARVHQSQRVGYGDTPSETYAAFEQFANPSASTELARLLHHPNPVVRSYTADYILRKRPAEVALLLPIFKDESRIAIQWGCSFGGAVDYVADVLRRLCLQAGQSAAAQNLLLAVGRDPAHLEIRRAHALRCVSEVRPKEAEPLVRSLLASTHPLVQHDVLLALLLIGPADRTALLKRFLATGGPPVRREVAASLTKPASRAELMLLGQLLDDPDPAVRMQALSSALKQLPGRVQAQVLLRAAEPAVRRIATYGLGALADPESLLLLAEHYRRQPADIPQAAKRPFGVDRSVLAAYVEFMRSMLRVPSPVRHLAIRELHAVMDLQSAAEIRSFLRSSHAEERIAAARAAGDFIDTEAAADVARLLAAPTAAERLAAARALTDIGACEQLPALRQAAAREPAPTSAQMHEHLQQLEKRLRAYREPSLVLDPIRESGPADVCGR